MPAIGIEPDIKALLTGVLLEKSSSAGFVAEEVGRWLIEVQLLLEDLHLIAVASD